MAQWSHLVILYDLTCTLKETKACQHGWVLDVSSTMPQWSHLVVQSGLMVTLTRMKACQNGWVPDFCEQWLNGVIWSSRAVW